MSPQNIDQNGEGPLPGFIPTYTLVYLNAMRGSARPGGEERAHRQALKASMRGYFLTQLSDAGNPLGVDQPVAGTGSLWDGPPKIRLHTTTPWHHPDELCIYRGCIPYGGCYIAATRAIERAGISRGNAVPGQALRVEGGEVALSVGGMKASQTSDRRIFVGANKPVYVAAGNYPSFSAQVLSTSNVAPGFPFSIVWTIDDKLAAGSEYMGEILREPTLGGPITATTVPEGSARVYVENPCDVTFTVTQDPAARSVTTTTTVSGQIIDVLGNVVETTAAAAGANSLIFLLKPL